MTFKNKIHQIVTRYDIEGLVELGAPHDEYEAEVASVYALYKSEKSFEEFFMEITALWQQSFALSDTDIKNRLNGITSMVKEILDA